MITYEISGRRYAEIIFKKVSIYMDFRVLQLSNYIYNIKGDDTMARLSYSISLILLNEILYETVMNAIVLPVFFLSTALFPADGISGILKAAININPFTHVINVLRDLILYGTVNTNSTIFVFVLFILMGSISFIWALHGLKKELSL